MNKKNGVNMWAIVALIISIIALFFSLVRVSTSPGYSSQTFILDDYHYLSPYLDFPEKTVKFICTENTEIVTYSVEYWTEIRKTDDSEAMCAVIYEEPNKYIKLKWRFLE